MLKWYENDMITLSTLHHFKIIGESRTFSVTSPFGSILAYMHLSTLTFAMIAFTLDRTSTTLYWCHYGTLTFWLLDCYYNVLCHVQSLVEATGLCGVRDIERVVKCRTVSRLWALKGVLSGGVCRISRLLCMSNCYYTNSWWQCAWIDRTDGCLGITGSDVEA